jgi:PelA/Pel-15E family pectate lyase
MKVLLFTFFLLGLAGRGTSASEADAINFTPIDTKPFGSCIQHWRKLRDPGRFIVTLPDQPSYEPTQVREIAENILLFQRDNGGWPKDYDMTAILTDDQRQQVIATRLKQDTSFDNDNIHSQVEYLAKALAQHPDPEWRDACQRGFDFMLRAQYQNGGYPQRFPEPSGYSAHITFNDGVMIGVLNVLMSAAEGASHFDWLDDQRRQLAKQAVEKGVQCILQCQIKVDGKLTGWCQQHDTVTFEPRPARTFELASLCPQDTTEIVYFLMRQQSLDQRQIQAIDCAVSWLKAVQLNGIRVEKVAAPPESFPGYDSDKDVVVTADAGAKPIWARHYEIGTNRPIFAGRDAVKRYSLAEIERERRAGTTWYGHWPKKLIDQGYPRFKLQVTNAQDSP